jgi:hypothetical protein
MSDSATNDDAAAIRRFVGRPDLSLVYEGYGRWHLPYPERSLPAQLVLNEFEVGYFRVDEQGHVREADMSPEVVPLFGIVPAEGAPIDRPTARRAVEAFLAGRLAWFDRLELYREETENRGLAPGGYAYDHHQFSWEARHGPHRAWGLGGVSVSVDSVGSLVKFVQWPPAPVTVSLEPAIARDEAVALALARYNKPITASEAELHVGTEELYWIVRLTGTEPWSNERTGRKGASYFIDAHTGRFLWEFVAHDDPEPPPDEPGAVSP